MFYKIGKNLFRFVINLIQLIRVLLVFLSFATVLFWILQLAGATYLEPVTPFFDTIKAWTHTFYNRSIPSGEVSVDFAFLIATFIFLLIVFGLKFVVEYIEDIEEKYDKIYKDIKKKTEEIFNLHLESEHIKKESKNNKMLILIKFNAKNLLKDNFFEKNADVGVEEKQKEILIDFCKNLEQKISLQKRFLNDGLLIYFDNFKDVNRIIAVIENEIRLVKNKYKEEKWYLNSIVSVETYSDEGEIINKIRNLVILVRLNLENMIVCLGTFQQRYSLIENKEYIIEAEGLYTINDTSQEEVFSVKKL